MSAAVYAVVKPRKPFYKFHQAIKDLIFSCVLIVTFF